MKSKLIIAGGSALVLGAVFITYLMKRRKTIKKVDEPLQLKRTHHLTNVFAQAKNHSN